MEWVMLAVGILAGVIIGAAFEATRGYQQHRMMGSMWPYALDMARAEVRRDDLGTPEDWEDE